MKEEKIKINGIDTYLYKTDKYTTLHVELYFLLDYSKRNYFLLELLENYMFETNKKYKTKKELLDLKYEMYSFDVLSNVTRFGEKIVFLISFEITDPKLVKDEYFSKLAKELHTLLFDVNFENSLPDQNILDKCKTRMIGNYESISADFSFISNTNFILNSYPNSIVSEIMLTSKEYNDLIKSIKGEELYKMYCDLFNNRIYQIYLFGNFSDDYIHDLEKNLTFKNHSNDVLEYKFFSPAPKKNIITEKFDSVETSIFVLYTFQGLTKEEKLDLITLGGILNFGGRILHKLFREEMNLVYSSYATARKHAETLSIVGNINANNKEKFLKGIDHLFNDVLTNKEEVEKSLTNLLKHVRDSVITKDEDKWSVLRDITSKKLYDDFTIEEIYDHIKKVTFNDIISLIKKAKKELVYIAEGKES